MATWRHGRPAHGRGTPRLNSSLRPPVAKIPGHARPFPPPTLSIKLLAVSGVNPRSIANPNVDFLPKDVRFNDHNKIQAAIGTYKPNPWGLNDMHGNVGEWTRSMFKAYPYVEEDGRNAASPSGEKVVRGGSWNDRPCRATSSFRLAYPSWQCVYNVGFRVICEEK